MHGCMRAWEFKVRGGSLVQAKKVPKNTQFPIKRAMEHTIFYATTCQCSEPGEQACPFAAQLSALRSSDRVKFWPERLAGEINS